jgi:hypothetical protein
VQPASATAMQVAAIRVFMSVSFRTNVGFGMID